MSGILYEIQWTMGLNKLSNQLKVQYNINNKLIIGMRYLMNRIDKLRKINVV